MKTRISTNLLIFAIIILSSSPVFSQGKQSDKNSIGVGIGRYYGATGEADSKLPCLNLFYEKGVFNKGFSSLKLGGEFVTSYSKGEAKAISITNNSTDKTVNYFASKTWTNFVLAANASYYFSGKIVGYDRLSVYASINAGVRYSIVKESIDGNANVVGARDNEFKGHIDGSIGVLLQARDNLAVFFEAGGVVRANLGLQIAL